MIRRIIFLLLIFPKAVVLLLLATLYWITTGEWFSLDTYMAWPLKLGEYGTSRSWKR